MSSLHKNSWMVSNPWPPLEVVEGGARGGDKARGDDNVFQSSLIRSAQQNLRFINFI